MADPFTDTMNIGGSLTPIISGTISIGIKIISGLLVLGVLFVIFLYYKNKKNYNIPVLICIPRSNNTIIDMVDGIGGYFKTKTRDGGDVTVFRLKRKGTPSIEIPPPSSHFLVGLNKRLFLVQKGVDDFEPIDPTSFLYVTTAEGRKIPIIDMKCINQDATAWVEDNREHAKKRFTFHGFWEKYKDMIQITIFIFIVMLSVYINWQGLKDVATALADVAQNLKGAPIVS